MANYLYTDKEFTSTGLKVRALDPASLVHDKADAIGGGNAYPKENDVLVIDIFLKFKDPEYQLYQDLGGIALLKFLRIKEVDNHIVLLSPWSLQQLLHMEPGYHILASPGITIAQYTYCVDELKGHDGVMLDLKELVTEKAPPKEKLRDWFKAGISLPKDERHNWANWWGIYALVEFQNAQYPKEYSKHWLLPAPVRDKLRQLLNAEVRYVYEALDAIDAQLPQPIEPVKARIVYIDDQANEGWEEVLRNCLDEDSRKALRTYVPATGQLKDKDGITALLEKKPDGERPALKEALKECDMVLLDLRLDAVNDKEVEQGEEEELSGIRLLKAIRELHPGMPVLMFTASTSAEVRERLLEFGVDRVWLKPGLDRSRTTGRSVLIELVRAVERLAKPDYALLRKLGDSRRAIDVHCSQWWREAIFGKWDLAQLWKHSDNLEMLRGLVDEIVEGTRVLLRKIRLDDFGVSHPAVRFELANTVSLCGAVVELFHWGNFHDPNGLHLYNNSERSREDMLGFILYQLRHQASHYSSARATRPMHLRIALACIGHYLSATQLPTSPTDPNVKTLWLKRWSAYGGCRRTTWWYRDARTKANCATHWVNRSTWLSGQSNPQAKEIKKANDNATFINAEVLEGYRDIISDVYDLLDHTNVLKP